MREDVTILLVDDVNTMRVQLQSLLSSFGFRKVRQATSLPEAVAMMRNEKFNLILADWHLEIGSGLELLRQVRSDPDHVGVAFILVTAENAKENVILAVKSGVDDYLVKPLTVDQIQTKVFGVLVRRKIL